MLRLEFEESQARSRSISDIWCIDPLDREAQGYCISFLQVLLLFFIYQHNVCQFDLKKIYIYLLDRSKIA